MTDWYAADIEGKSPGDSIGRPQVYVAESLPVAVAYFRHSESEIYRVAPIDYPVKSDWTPGLRVCTAAEVVEHIADPCYPREELWPLVAGVKWQGGEPMYQDDGRITTPPGVPNFPEPLKRQYLLPALVAKALRSIAPHGGYGYWF